jgi:diacylglycerol O-acyltransferase
MTGARLSTLEASYLCFEHPGRPIHVGAIAVFEGAPLLDADGRLRLDDIRAHVASRVPLLPRLRQRMARGRLGLDRPRWVDDPSFDVADHVTEVALPAPADEADLRRVAEELHTAPLDLERAPWDAHFVTGLAGGRVALVERAHHSLVDGVGGIDLAAVLLDIDAAGTVPVATVLGSSPAPEEAPPPAGVAGQAGRLLTAPLRAGASVLQPIAGGVLHPLATARQAVAVAGALATVVDNGLLAPRTSLDVEPGGRRRLAWTGAPLADVRAAGRWADATVNDVVLAAVAGGLRALLVGRGEPIPHNLALKAMIPVSEREVHDDASLGNQVTAILTPLPVGVADAGTRLDLVTAAMRRLKARHEADGFHAALRAADVLPMPLVRALVYGLEHQPLVNLVVTNVPGPPVPLYLLGARMLDAIPVVPLAANLSVGVAVLSYDGTLRICVNGDAEACPDVDVMAAGIARDLQQLIARATRHRDDGSDDHEEERT